MASAAFEKNSTLLRWLPVGTLYCLPSTVTASSTPFGSTPARLPDVYTELTSATRPLRAYAWVEEPTKVCQTSGGSPAVRREASTTETLLPPPPATAPSTTVTPLCAAL